MDRLMYERAAATHETHWWFTGRRAILQRLLASLALPPQARILEVGCGPGANIGLLRGFGTVAAVEQEAFSRELVRAHNVEVLPGALPDELPYAGREFDLVCLFDVLEHVDRDVDALRTLRGRLAPDGLLIVTVPAYQWLYSTHDAQCHHRRRYSARQLARAARAARLRPMRLGYYNTLLFPLAVIRRLATRWSRATEDPDLPMPAPLVNRLLHRVFAAEASFAGRTFFPFGLSVIGIFRRN